MTKRMLIDATHAEETRVVVLDDNKLEDFDVEASAKRQLKGNIYLAKIIRVEPSLQAAFVEYGGGRHGFLAFSEIHPDYYQIPVADRQRLLALQAEEAREAEAEEEAATAVQPEALPPLEPESGPESQPESQPGPASPVAPDTDAEPAGADQPQAARDEPPPTEVVAEIPDAIGLAPAVDAERQTLTSEPVESENGAGPDEAERPWTPAQPAAIPRAERFAPMATAPEPDPPGGEIEAEPVAASVEEPADIAFEGAGAAEPTAFDIPDAEEPPPPEVIGGDDGTADGADAARVRRTSRLLRSYRIQEVIHRRQIVLVQVVKEERGTKGAALTTYISLAGRFSVLMPNSPRGGGISRKITSAADRKRLKEITAELDLPQGMGLIVRTAGANRPKPEIKRDCEYLMRLWDDIREHTLRSVAPALIYEEANLIKRAIRDVYSRDIDEIIVDGEEGWHAAHEFMRMLMPSHANKVQLWRAAAHGGQPLFAKYQVESQLDAMLSPTVQLRSGGYLVINQTEALVAIDVNSGRSTRERNIEETALRTNLEAADEAARQLRLRDLAGLIVIDFIDMESRKHNAAVERRLKEALKADRARIQVGHISHFGLLEMSRQRLRPSLAETSFDPCPHCGGTGHVRSTDSSAISVLRAIEDEGAKAKASVIMVHASGAVEMYLLNHKRERLAEIEARFGMRVQFALDDSLAPGRARIERLRALTEPPPRTPVAVPVIPAAPPALLADTSESDEEDGDEADEPDAAEAAAGSAEDNDRRRRRRRRRRGARRDNGHDAEAPAETAAEADAPPTQEVAATVSASSADTGQPDIPDQVPQLPGGMEPALAGSGDQPNVDPADLDEDGQPRARRRGRRGGRRRRRDGDDAPSHEAPVAEASDSDVASPYGGPTPANPYGHGAFDIFDVIDTAGELYAVAPGQPGAQPSGEAEPEPGPEPQPVLQAEPEPRPEPAPEPAPEPEPEPEPVRNEPVVGPAMQPLVIGAGEPIAERKRGWWRR